MPSTTDDMLKGKSKVRKNLFTKRRKGEESKTKPVNPNNVSRTKLRQIAIGARGRHRPGKKTH